MSYGIYNHETVNNCIDSMVREIEQQQERIAELESLVRDLWDGYDCFQCPLFCDACKVKSQEQMEAVWPCRMMQRISTLGIEVDR